MIVLNLHVFDETAGSVSFFSLGSRNFFAHVSLNQVHLGAEKEVIFLAISN